MDYINHSNMISFNHALYGRAYLVPNRDFNPSANPTAINYILENSMIVRASGISDAGLNISLVELKKLGY
jgi:hypothetical protein